MPGSPIFVYFIFSSHDLILNRILISLWIAAHVSLYIMIIIYIITIIRHVYNMINNSCYTTYLQEYVVILLYGMIFDADCLHAFGCQLTEALFTIFFQCSFQERITLFRP